MARNTIRNFWRDEAGGTAIEYGLIAGLVGLALVFGLTNLQTALNTLFGSVESRIPN